MKMKLFFLNAVLIFAAFLPASASHHLWSGKLYNSGSPQTTNPDKGIGPFQNVTLAPVDKDKVKKGLSVFTSKCALCHELDINKVGPPLRNAAKTYAPEFILNMIVNPLEMQKSNATTKELVKKYNNVPMPDQKISQEDALSIFEYLRSVAK